MAIGERIRHIRNLRGMTQRELGVAIGFDAKSADVRIAQYESGTRTPKDNLINAIAHTLNVTPQALDVPNIDSYTSVAHTLFALEDLYGLKIGEIDGELCLRLDKFKGADYRSMFEIFSAWQKEAEKLKSEEISKEDYDTWRYNYPRIEAERFKAELDARRAEKGEHDETHS